MNNGSSNLNSDFITAGNARQTAEKLMDTYAINCAKFYLQSFLLISLSALPILDKTSETNAIPSLVERFSTVNYGTLPTFLASLIPIGIAAGTLFAADKNAKKHSEIENLVHTFR